jgi:hypothetical protein
MEAHTAVGCAMRVVDMVKELQAEVKLHRWILTKIAEDMMRDEYGKDRRNNELLKAVWDGRFDKAIDIKTDEEAENENHH